MSLSARRTTNGGSPSRIWAAPQAPSLGDSRNIKENWPGYAQLPGTFKKLLLSSGRIWTPRTPGQGSVIAFKTTLVLESIRTSGQGKSRSTSVQHFACVWKRVRNQRDPAGNVAWAALYSFTKVAARTTALEPPGRILNSLSEEKNFRWCEQFVKVITTEAVIREHLRRLIDIRSSADWLAGTYQIYKLPGLGTST